jgi:transcriptional regulator with XRE-family HTH domain
MSLKRLSRVIKQLREAKEMSQQALANKVGVTAAYITMLETEKRKSPSLPVLKRLAKALGVPVTELLG